jgi:glucoamylase
MRPLSSSFLGVVSLVCSGALANPAHPTSKPTHLDAFITSEMAIALQGALNNIGPNGSKVPGAGAGFVVASPSTTNPNCQYLLINWETIPRC